MTIHQISNRSPLVDEVRCRIEQARADGYDQGYRDRGLGTLYVNKADLERAADKGRAQGIVIGACIGGILTTAYLVMIAGFFQ